MVGVKVLLTKIIVTIKLSKVSNNHQLKNSSIINIIAKVNTIMMIVLNYKAKINVNMIKTHPKAV